MVDQPALPNVRRLECQSSPSRATTSITVSGSCKGYANNALLSQPEAIRSLGLIHGRAISSPEQQGVTQTLALVPWRSRSKKRRTTSWPISPNYYESRTSSWSGWILQEGWFLRRPPPTCGPLLGTVTPRDILWPPCHPSGPGRPCPLALPTGKASVTRVVQETVTGNTDHFIGDALSKPPSSLHSPALDDRGRNEGQVS